MLSQLLSSFSLGAKSQGAGNCKPAVRSRNRPLAQGLTETLEVARHEHHPPVPSLLASLHEAVILNQLSHIVANGDEIVGFEVNCEDAPSWVKEPFGGMAIAFPDQPQFARERTSQ